MLAGVTVVNMGDVEDRFDLSKSDSAIIASGANIGFCVFVIFVSYFGENWNKAVAIAVSSGIFGIGAFFYALPHFTTGLHEIAESRFQCNELRYGAIIFEQINNFLDFFHLQKVPMQNAVNYISQNIIIENGKFLQIVVKPHFYF